MGAYSLSIALLLGGVARLGPDRVARKNIGDRSVFLQKDLDTLSRARADLHTRLAEIRLQIDDDGVGKRSIDAKAKVSIARVFWRCATNVNAQIDDGICGG